MDRDLDFRVTKKAIDRTVQDMFPHLQGGSDAETQESLEEDGDYDREEDCDFAAVIEDLKANAFEAIKEDRQASMAHLQNQPAEGFSAGVMQAILQEHCTTLQNHYAVIVATEEDD